MNRFSRLFAASCAAAVVVFASCASDPVARPRSGIEKFGAGGADETGTAPGTDGAAHGASPAKAAAVSPAQKIKTEEALAKATLYEAEIDEKLAERDYEGAIASYESLAGALTGVPAGLQRIDDNRRKVSAALASIRLDAVSSPAETPAGTAFKKDFALFAYALEGTAKVPLAGLKIAVSGPNGAEERTTGADGTLSYTAPVPAKPGRGELVMSAALDSTESALRDDIAFGREKGFLRRSFPHVVSSNAKKYATTISILDFDKAGNPIKSNNYSATTLLKPLVQKGFSRIGMADFPTQLASGDEEALLKAAKAQFGSAVRRFIYGTTRVESLSQGADGLWTCVLRGDVAVHDFTDAASVYRTTVTATMTGKTEAAALQAARTELAGSVLVQDLYYNM